MWFKIDIGDSMQGAWHCLSCTDNSEDEEKPKKKGGGRSNYEPAKFYLELLINSLRNLVAAIFLGSAHYHLATFPSYSCQKRES